MTEENTNITKDDQPSMEEAFAKLKAVLDKMEGSELPLEENFKLYEEGLSLVKLCNEKLDAIEKKIIVLEEGQQ